MYSIVFKNLKKCMVNANVSTTKIVVSFFRKIVMTDLTPYPSDRVIGRNGWLRGTHIVKNTMGGSLLYYNYLKVLNF